MKRRTLVHEGTKASLVPSKSDKDKCKLKLGGFINLNHFESTPTMFPQLPLASTRQEIFKKTTKIKQNKKTTVGV